ncbi:universal stress protein [Marinoscillum luteum]|mgnify:CR=1 FL=1|uniref:Universal stress protein n=1 Tax=Marinoscillum luteum TaxID=861051 RepID=A0ABW7N8J0_9BACT
MKKILVPTDFSDCARYASDTAMQIAKRAGAELHFYHHIFVPVDWVVVDFGHGSSLPDISEEEKGVLEQLKNLESEAFSQGIKCVTHMDYDTSSESITRYAAAQDISLIVMGSHGAKGIKEFFIGSNAQNVVKHANIPVLIIKNKPVIRDSPTVLFASDFHTEALNAFRLVAKYAKKIGSKIHLVYLNTPAEFKRSWVIRDRMDQFIDIASDSLAKAEIVDCLFLEEGLQNYCEENEIELLAMATHHRKGLPRMFMGSITEQVVNHMEIPVVSIPIT